MYRSGTTQGLKTVVAMLNLLLFFLSPLHKKLSVWEEMFIAEHVQA